MKNFIQSGAVITVPAPAAKSSGDGVLVGDLFGVAQVDAANGANVPIVVLGVFQLPKATSQAWTVGAKVYWDNTNSNCTTTASGNTLIGVATAAALAADTDGEVRLNGANT